MSLETSPEMHSAGRWTERRIFTPEDARITPYPEIPFAVPPGVRGVQVELEVSDPAASIDLGYLDPQGPRGWSGGARQTYRVTTTHATPGYLPGVFRPGQHAVLLGLYHVPPGGVEVSVSISLLPEGPLRWIRGDLHAHTHHSDAAGSPGQLAASARDRALEFLAVADHNTVSHHAFLSATDPMLLPAQEVTTYQGHFVAHGAAPALDFRITDEAALLATLEQARRLRLLTVLAHPAPTCPSCDWSWGHEAEFDALEVWNGPWSKLNWHARRRWLALLDAGVRMPITGGSDRHQPDRWPDDSDPQWQTGSPTTWLHAASAHPNDVYRAVLANRTCLSESPSGPRIELTLHADELQVHTHGDGLGQLVIYGGRAELLRQDWQDDQRLSLPLKDTDGPYLRAEIVRAATASELQSLQEYWPKHASDPEAAEVVRAMTGALWREPGGLSSCP